ncbi:MAG: alpha/beta hydrolase [Novosphingobium sp.]
MTEHFIRPDVQAYLDMIKAMSRPAMSDALVAMMRQMPPEMMPSQDLPVGELAEIRDFAMPGPAGEIALRLFDVRAEREPGPVVVFFHGGGFVVGSIETHAALAAEISRGLDLPVVSVEYRLAPEHKWPAGPDDAEAAARWIAGNGLAALGRELTGLVLCGDSAGGNLTAVTAMALRDTPAALPVVLQLAIYPVAGRPGDHPSYSIFGEGFALDGNDMAYFDSAYASDKAHWRGSPAGHDLSGMPPAVVVTAGLDPLRDDGRAYADKLAAAGVPVRYHNFEGTIHGFASYRQHLPSARDDLAEALDMARAMLRGEE